MTQEQVYDSLIELLMSQVIAICKEHKIPMLASFSLDDDGLTCTTSLLSEEWEPPESFVAALEHIVGKPAKPLTLTTRNAAGEITAIETIL